MTREQLQQQCQLGQQQLMQTRYLEAIETLAAAEALAWDARDYDTLARLYMPLQEARRQARQRCGEGIVSFDIRARGPDDQRLSPQALEDFSHGQLLVAGWGSIQPALAVRQFARDRRHYLETFLAAVFPIVGGSIAVVVVPLQDVALPDTSERSIDALIHRLPAHSIILGPGELPPGPRPGSTQTFGEVMAMWERLHRPFLAAADAQTDPLRKMDGYRLAIRVDPACELAHQHLSDVAKQLKRSHVRG